MMRRRELLGTAAAGTTALLAGCSRCGETWYGQRLSFAMESIARTADGYELTVSATVAFEFPKDDRDGVGTFDFALYGADRSVLAAETVESLRWGQVPEQERIDGECGESGTATAIRTVTVPELPHYVGPRFHDGREAASLDPGSSAGFHELTALRYREAAPADGNGSENGPTASDEAGTTRTPAGDGTTTADATATDPAEVAPSDYDLVSVERLPWPTPDLQALDATESLTNVRFVPIRGCYGRSDPSILTSLFQADLGLRWSRPVPEEGCLWPALTDLSVADGRLAVDVGLETVPYARCDPCDARRYQLLVDYRDDREVAVEEVLIRHLSRDGSVVERRLETVGRDDEPRSEGDGESTGETPSGEATTSGDEPA